MKRTIDYKNYDALRVSVKERHVDELISAYRAFGWAPTEMKGDEVYDDVIDMSFVRPHNVENKDDLQYLQVCAEMEINKRDKLSRKKHSRSSSVGLVLGISGVALIVFGIYLALVGSALYVVSGAALGVLGCVACVFCPILTKKFVREEKIEFARRYKESLKKSEEILKKAAELNGGAKV